MKNFRVVYLSVKFIIPIGRTRIQICWVMKWLTLYRVKNQDKPKFLKIYNYQKWSFEHSSGLTHDGELIPNHTNPGSCWAFYSTKTQQNKMSVAPSKNPTSFSSWAHLSTYLHLLIWRSCASRKVLHYCLSLVSHKQKTNSNKKQTKINIQNNPDRWWAHNYWFIYLSLVWRTIRIPVIPRQDPLWVQLLKISSASPLHQCGHSWFCHNVKNYHFWC